GAEEPMSAAAPETPPEALVDAGRELALGGPDSTGTPACAACLGPWPTRRSPLFPTLVGQRIDYLVAQLRLWQGGHRGGHSRAHIMHLVAELLDPGDIDALAAFYAAGAPMD